MAQVAVKFDSRKDVVYEYLCHLEEARKWIESVLQQILPDTQQWISSLCNGICLSKLGKKLAPDLPCWKKIYDSDETRYKTKGLEYRHTDNINFFLITLAKLGLPKVFFPSTVDIFESKNTPQLVYCLHALSHFLKAKGTCKETVPDLYGKAKFSEEAVGKISAELETSNRELPAFNVVENLVEEELQYESMGLTVDALDDNSAANGSTAADAERDTTPPVAAATVSSPQSATPGNNKPPAATIKVTETTNLAAIFDDPAYAEIQLMIDNMQNSARSFNGSFANTGGSNSGGVTKPPPRPPKSPEAMMMASGVANKAVSPPEGGAAVASSSPVVEYTCKDSSVKAVVYSQVDKLKKRKKNSTNSSGADGSIVEVDQVMQQKDPAETVRVLKAVATANRLNYVFADIKYADLYHEALEKEKQCSVPRGAVVIFRGINREKCEKLLEKSSPGGYILRACPDSSTEFVFSYRNQLAIKHWKLVPTNGRYTWGNSPAFDKVEDFIENFTRCLSNATKLHVYPCTTLNLQPDQTDAHGVKQKLENGEDQALTREQINRVIVEVNSTINSLRRSEKGPENPIPPPLPEKLPAKSWSSKSVRKLSRSDAETLLMLHGKPGSFLVRPSETESGGYAIVFRTGDELKRWKVTSREGHYFVHPRPQQYPSLEKVVEAFVVGLKDHTGIDMANLDLPEDLTPASSDQPPASGDSKLLLPTMVPRRHTSVMTCSTSTPSRESSPGYGRSNSVTQPYSHSNNTKQVYDHLNFSRSKQANDIPELPSPNPKRESMYSSLSREDSMPTPSLSKLNPYNITSWSVNDVAQWLTSEDLGQFVEEFVQNVIDGECLINLDQAQLRDDLGVKALGHRHRLMKKINKLKETCGLPTF